MCLSISRDLNEKYFIIFKTAKDFVNYVRHQRFHFILICPFYEQKKDFIFKNKTYLPINLFNCCQQLLSESNHVFGGKKLLQVKKILRYKKIFGGDPLYYHVFITIIVPYLFYHYQF